MKEVIFVGLPGPTHNYGGLSQDNVASSSNRGTSSNPKLAALQALGLVKLLKKLGMTAAVLPPQQRPYLPVLRQQFTGGPDALITAAARQNPALLEKIYSSSAMWTANAATVSPAPDCADHKLHLTVANLYTNLHRRIEADDTYRVLKAIFARVPGAVVHNPLASELRDEGAANHMRLCPRHDMPALNVFVYGADGSPNDPPTARQTFKAFEAIARQHGLDTARTLMLKQNPGVIQQGVFHNDVIAVANESVLLAHEQAYSGGMGDLDRIADRYQLMFGNKLAALVIHSEQLSVEEAVRTYFFNSQIISKPSGGMAIIAPTEVKELYGGKAARLIDDLCRDGQNPIEEVHYADLRQSMNNGGGPACLRLRVVLSDEQLAAVRQHVRVVADEPLVEKLEALVNAHYPDEIAPAQLANPELYWRCHNVLRELSRLMQLPLVVD